MWRLWQDVGATGDGTTDAANAATTNPTADASTTDSAYGGADSTTPNPACPCYTIYPTLYNVYGGLKMFSH